MADCGATGSALDRTAAQFISSVLSGAAGNGNHASSTGPSASLAGKAIASFVTGVAGNTQVIDGHSTWLNDASHSHKTPLMPASIPNTISLMQPPQDVNHRDVIQRGGGDGPVALVGDHWKEGPMMESSHRMYPGEDISKMGRNSMGAVQSWQVPQHMQPNAVQFQMMQQQMALMKMVQEQKMYQEYQQQQQWQQQQQQQQQQRMQQQENFKALDKMNEQDLYLQQENVQDSLNDWHQNIEDEFRSYFNSYKNDIAQDDAISTNQGYNQEEDLGHEGYVEGVSMERLAAAWEEAEREFSTEDYANLGSAYDDDAYYYYEGATDVHVHYEFSQDSERYGLQQDNIQNNDNNVAEKYMDLMSEGMKHFHQGNLSEAILCFESELRNVNGDNADAWLMLGKCHAENDEDRKAIICLENAVERDPYSSEALLALGVSYVNELDHDRALKYLNNWVTHNPSYAGSITSPKEMDGQKVNALMKLKSLLNQAKDYDVSMNGNSESSADVLETLGVLCNVSREYIEAAECFQSALNVRPHDHQLWNKLGATLANSGRSEEAQEAYQKALSIKPRYARSWLNMAIAHSNLQNHDEASRCYLQALSLNPGAVHIWSYLRISLTCMERWDLLPLAASQDLDGFREYFDFVK